ANPPRAGRHARRDRAEGQCRADQGDGGSRGRAAAGTPRPRSSADVACGNARFRAARTSEMGADPRPYRHHTLIGSRPSTQLRTQAGMAASRQARRALLDAKGIAVVGASQQPGRGASVVANLRAARFNGEVVAVNPRYSEVLGYRCVPSVAELPETIDCLVM